MAWSAAPTEQNAYRPFSEICTVEIVDSTSGDVIRRPDVKGALVVTSYVRLQAPAICMDTGDNAFWRDPPGAPGARFALCGRRFINRYPLAAAEFDSHQVGTLIKRLLPHLPLLMLWLEITCCGDRPQITIALSLYGLAAPPADLERRVLMAWENVAPAIAAEVQRQHLPPPRVRLVDFSYFFSGLQEENTAECRQTTGVPAWRQPVTQPTTLTGRQDMNHFANIAKMVTARLPNLQAAHAEGLTGIRTVPGEGNSLTAADGHRFINMCSYFYLGLLGLNLHPAITAGAIQALEQEGMISTSVSRARIAPRLLDETEALLREVFRRDTLVVPSCFMLLRQCCLCWPAGNLPAARSH